MTIPAPKLVYYYDPHMNKVVAMMKATNSAPYINGSHASYVDAAGRTLALSDKDVFGDPIECMIKSVAARQFTLMVRIHNNLDLFDMLFLRMRNHGGTHNPDHPDVPLYCYEKTRTIRSPIGIFMPCLANMGVAKNDYAQFFSWEQKDLWASVFPWLTTNHEYCCFANMMMNLEHIHDTLPYPQWEVNMEKVKAGTYATNLPERPEPELELEIETPQEPMLTEAEMIDTPVPSLPISKIDVKGHIHANVFILELERQRITVMNIEKIRVEMSATNNGSQIHTIRYLCRRADLEPNDEMYEQWWDSESVFTRPGDALDRLIHHCIESKE